MQITVSGGARVRDGAAERGAADLAATHGDLTVVLAPGEGTVPQRRLAALDGVDSELVAFVEDTTVPEGGWVSALREAFRDDPRLGAAGGPVWPGPGLSAAGAGLLFFDLGPFVATDYAGRDLPGNAICFRTSALREALAGEDGLRRTDVLPALWRGNWRTRFVAGAATRYERGDPTGLRLLSQFHQGRAWCGRARRAGDMGPGPALVRTAAWPAVAGVRWSRALRALSVHRARHGGVSSPVRTLAMAAGLSLAWGAGECLGAALGPGRGEEAWR